MTDGGISPYGTPRNSVVRRIRTHHLQAMKDRHERWAMLTAYDMHSASIFDEVGIPVLLVGDSAANNVFGFDTTLPVTVDELLPLVRAVVRSTRSSLVVADLPFGSYQVSPEQALQTAIRFMKEGGAQAVKLEGGRTGAAADPRDRRRRHPGHGAPRLHAAERARPRRLPGPGPRRVGAPPDRRRARDRGRRRVRDGARDGPGPRRRADHQGAHGSRRSVSAPARAATRRSWSGPTWPGMNSGPAPRFVKRYADLRGVTHRGGSGLRRGRRQRHLPGARAQLRRLATGGAFSAARRAARDLLRAARRERSTSDGSVPGEVAAADARDRHARVGERLRVRPSQPKAYGSSGRTHDVRLAVAITRRGRAVG